MAASFVLQIIIILERICHLSAIFYVKFVKCNLRISYCHCVYICHFRNSISHIYIGMCEIIYIPSFKCVDAIALLVTIKLEAIQTETKYTDYVQ